MTNPMLQPDMTFTEYVSAPFRNEGPLMVIAMLVCFFIETSCFHIFKNMKFFKKMKPKEQIDFGVRFVSVCHCLAAFASIPSWFYPEPQIANDLFGYSWITSKVAACSAGYFAWDVVTSFRYDDTIGFKIHAIATFPLFYLAAGPFLHKYVGYFDGIFELSTVPLSLRAMGNYANLRKTSPSVMQFVDLWFFISFTAVRVLGGSYVVYYWWSEMLAAVPLTNVYGSFFIYYFIFANGVLMLLQYYWFALILGRLFAGDKKKEKPAAKKSSKKA